MVSYLISRRGQLKGNLTRFWNYVSATDNDPKQINVRRSKIEDAWEEFHQENQNNIKSQKTDKIMAQNSLCFRSEESSYIDTLIMKLLKSSMEKENDDHDVFGAYVAMEMRNLKTSDAQNKLRGEIRDSISRVVREESMTTIDHKKPNLEFKEIDNDLKREDNLLKTNLSHSSENHLDVDTISQEKRKISWEFIN